MKQIKSFKGDYSFLSNFYPCDIYYDGIKYPSNEHFYCAMKTNDPAIRRQIAALPTPGQAKRFGRKIDLIEHWDELRIDFMYMCVYEKFIQNIDLAKKLHDTIDYELIEGNTWGDTFWGVCDGVGDNRLGLILMQVRTHNAIAKWNIWNES